MDGSLRPRMIWVCVTLIIAFLVRIVSIGMDSLFDYATLAMFWSALATLLALLVLSNQRPLRFWIISSSLVLIVAFFVQIVSPDTDSLYGYATFVIFWFFLAALLAFLVFGLMRGLLRWRSAQ